MIAQEKSQKKTSMASLNANFFLRSHSNGSLAPGLLLPAFFSSLDPDSPRLYRDSPRIYIHPSALLPRAPLATSASEREAASRTG